MIDKLTEEDRKILKYEKRIGYVFSGIIVFCGGMFNLLYFTLNNTLPDYLLIGLINLGILMVAYFVCNRINLKINRDLKDNTKMILKRKVEQKIEEKSYEAGSGTLFIGQEMKETMKYLIITTDNRYEIDKDLYDNIDKDTYFYIHLAKHSEIIVAFSKAYY